MEQYISKSDLVSELEKRTDELYDLLPNASKVENGMITISEACNTGKYTALESFKDYVDTLEVKEVNLDKEIDRVWDNTSENFLEDGWKEFEDIAKHFFELGTAVSNKAQKGKDV